MLKKQELELYFKKVGDFR